MKPNDFIQLAMVCYSILIFAGLFVVLMKKNDRVNDNVFYDAITVILSLGIIVTLFVVVYFGTL